MIESIAVIFVVLAGIFVQIKKNKKDTHKNEEHFSEVVLITCGDYRVAAFVRKYIKRIHEKWEMDIATTAGGARTIAISIGDISIRNLFLSTWEYLLFSIKRWALWIDLEAYLGHNADTIVIANHKYCAKCPIFGSDEAEDGFHIRILLAARDIIKKKYPKIKEVILLYVIINKETHEASKVIEIKPSGEIKTIVIKEEERLAYAEKELERIKQKNNISQ